MFPVMMRTGVVVAIALLPFLGGCSSAHHSTVDTVVSRFYDAYNQQKGNAACALLAPATRKQVATSAGMPCGKALLQEKLPRVGRITDTSVYGDQAQVRLRGDTAFLAEFPGGWKV